MAPTTGGVWEVCLTLDLTMQDGNLSNFKRAGAGFAAGITEALIIVTPFEVVKIKLQQQKGTSKELLRYKVCCHTGQLHHRASLCMTVHQQHHVSRSQLGPVPLHEQRRLPVTCRKHHSVGFSWLAVNPHHVSLCHMALC